MRYRQNCLTIYRAGIALALVAATAFAVDLTFEIPPVPETVEVAGRPVALTLSGEVSGSPAPPGANDQSFNLNLRADLGEFQSHLTPLLKTELDRSERCGDRIAIQNATLVPAAPATHLTVQLHFERWICIQALGDAARKLAGGDATVHVILTPHVEKRAAPGGDQPVRLDAEVGAIDASGGLTEALRSGPLGTAVREKIREILARAIKKAVDMEGVMPVRTRRYVTIQSIAFVDAGFGRLALDLAGRLTIPGEEVSTVLEEFGNR